MSIQDKNILATKNFNTISFEVYGRIFQVLVVRCSLALSLVTMIKMLRNRRRIANSIVRESCHIFIFFGFFAMKISSDENILIVVLNARKSLELYFF